MRIPNQNKVFRLSGKVQHYPWGGTSFLPQLLGLANPDNRPFAEYWLGAHDQASSEVLVEGKSAGRLNDIIRGFPRETLGADVYHIFGRLPYLMKILDVQEMLSIQVHPSKKMAEIEFAAENRRGIPLDSSGRNYKDDNHKPEIMVALSDFWLLHGFRPKAFMDQILEVTPELRFLLPVFQNGGYKSLYHTVMKMDQAEINLVLSPLLSRIMPVYIEGKLDKGSPDFWACRAALSFAGKNRIDRGIFSIYLFNLLRLNPGEGIFQDAGLPHAYLEGQNVELMANSDNVLRGGLTSKHVDVRELMKHVRFEETVPQPLQKDGSIPGITVFSTPAPDFELSRVDLKKEGSVNVQSASAEISVLLKGRIAVREHQGNAFDCNPGQAWVSFHGARFEARAMDEAVLFRATVPLKKTGS